MRIVALATLGIATIAPRPDGAAGCLAGADDAVEVTVEVVNGEDAWVEAYCPGWSVEQVDESVRESMSGSFDPVRTLAFDPGWLAGPCQVRAYRTDGGLTHRTAATSITDALDETHIELVLPSEPQGGAGIGIASSCSGVRVVGVVPGGPADRAGIEVGSRIESVQGERVGGDTWRVIDRTAGAVGTPVTLTVIGRDGERTTHRVEREYLTSGW